MVPDSPYGVNFALVLGLSVLAALSHGTGQSLRCELCFGPLFVGSDGIRLSSMYILLSHNLL